MKNHLPGFADVQQAAHLLKGHGVRTPLLTSSVLNEQLNANIYFKAECLQRTGSFKFRGAFNAMHHGGDRAKENGVIACSSGNHAQGVAEAARLKGYQATIIMPSDAPESKKHRTRRSGAEIIEYDRFKDDREALLLEKEQESGAYSIHPYENFHVIAGQGTCGLEIVEQAQALNLEVDTVLVCAGGGGLLAGIKLAMDSAFPEAAIHTVEPLGFDDQRLSHESGKRIQAPMTHSSICDAIVTSMPGKLSFEICSGQLAEGLVVSDEEVLAAMAFAHNEMKVVVEPGGCVTLAALLARKLDVNGKTIMATLSGGNVDAAMMARALAATSAPFQNPV